MLTTRTNRAMCFARTRFGPGFSNRCVSGRPQRRSRTLKRLALALALAAAPLFTARADTLSAGQAKTTALADWYANIYCTEVEGTYEVVITIAPGPDHGGRPMRFVGRLANGQSQEISIGGFGENTRLTILKVSRASDQISFEVNGRNVSWHERMSKN
jgi:hypothetical protein